MNQTAKLRLECQLACALLRKAGFRAEIAQTFDRSVVLGVEVRHATQFSFIGSGSDHHRVVAENLFFNLLGVGGVERAAKEIIARNA